MADKSTKTGSPPARRHSVTTSSTGISSKKKERPSEEAITRDYNTRLRASRSLAEELKFILRESIGAARIKVHEIDARVKELESTLKKIRDKEYASLDRVGDLVGGRVVCLFQSDLDKVKSIIEEQFQIDEFDDKMILHPDSFGYMSLHFQCRLRQDYSGPRYDSIKSISFELQLRTICMHAWSAVQHYLEYKGDWDVPNHLRKDINALSALFYVADSQFEAAYASKLEGSTQAAQSIATNDFSDQPINLDTVEAFIATKFPDRVAPSANAVSKLIQELTKADYKNLGEVAKDVSRAEKALVAYEQERGQGPFHAIGAVRISLGLSSKKYRDTEYKNDTGFGKHHHLVDKI